MNILRSVLNSHIVFWVLLAIPSRELISDIWLNDSYYAEIMYESGTWSVIFMVMALAITPIMKITKNWRPVFWLQRRRRAIGVASFGYAALHTFFYIRYVGNFELIVLEALDTAFLLGWIAFLALIVLATTSNQTSVRKLGKLWKPLQRMAYAALALSLLHWLWIDQFIPDLIVWTSIIVCLQAIRLIMAKSSPRKRRLTSSLPQ